MTCLLGYSEGSRLQRNKNLVQNLVYVSGRRVRRTYRYSANRFLGLLIIQQYSVPFIYRVQLLC